VLPVRVILNRVYVYLVDGRDAEQREALDSELYAPDGGWAAAETQVGRRLDEAVVADGVAQ
jgi:hypothetical protein